MKLLKKALHVLFWPFRLWRLFLAGAALLAVTHIAVDQMLLHKLAIQVEQIRSAGRPVTYADLHLPEYTVIDNAHAVYEQVMDMIKKEPDSTAWSHYSPLVDRYLRVNPCAPLREEQPLSADERAELGAYLQSMQPAFDLLHKSRDCRVCIIPDFMNEVNSVGVEGETHAVQLPGLSRMRELTRYATAKGLWEYQQGNIDAAFDWFAVGLNIANNHYCHPTLIGTLNGIGCVTTVLGAVQLALYDGDIPASLPDAFNAELQKCLDRNIYAQTFENERLYSNEISVRMGFRSWRVMRPMFSLDQFKMNQLYLELADTLRTADFSRQETTLNALRQWSGKSSRMYLMTRIVVPAWLRSVESIRRSMAASGLCETALELKQFQKRSGAYPESLSELAQAPPADPFSGNPFQYSREDKGFVLTSAGRTVAYQGKTKVETNLKWCTVK